MPSGRKQASHAVDTHILSDQTSSHGHGQSQQIKVCADCSRHLPPEQSVLHDEVGNGNPEDTIILCLRCRQTRLDVIRSRDERRNTHHTHGAPSAATFTFVSDTVTTLGPIFLGLHPPTTTSRDSDSTISSPTFEEPVPISDASSTPSCSRATSQTRVHPTAPSTPSSSSRKLLPLEPTSSSKSASGLPLHQRQRQQSTTLITGETHHESPISSIRNQPDPYVDITRLRIRQRGYDCLYAGATFCGVQKSGRNSYDVTVTIVDVDFDTSFLCGYLEIRGLTEDWPELTTYFDAEIIGSRYGFLTRGWGATEQEDMTHWNRFQPFRTPCVQEDLKQPYLTLAERPNRGCVFMRWKERFLVPDHRVKDINGASFAGFYYVCVEFDPKERLQMRSPSTPSHASSHSLGSRAELQHEFYRNDLTKGEVTASMSGYYFHQNSEPYQQLSLHHVPDTATGYFEFR